MNTYLHDIKDNEIYEDLRRALSSKDLILFAGSGLSAQAIADDGRHPPLWKGLLEGMINWCLSKRLISTRDVQEIRDLVEQGFLIDAGQELQEDLEPSHLQQCLGEVILCNQARPGAAHYLIAKIGFRAYLTTNYDEFIEGAFWREKGVRLQQFYERSIKGVLGAYREKKPFIVKLHGDISDPSSIILGNRSYQRLLYSDTTYRSCLETIFSMSSVLFIGFGASDPDLEGIISRVAAFDGRSKRHWMLVPEGMFPLRKAKRLWKDYGINVIQYDSDPTHSGVVRFLQKLATPPSLAPTVPEDQDRVKSFERRRTIETVEKQPASFG
jgi:hypothetical protein